MDVTYIVERINAKFKGINLIIGSHTFTEFFGIESLALKLEKTLLMQLVEK